MSEENGLKQLSDDELVSKSEMPLSAPSAQAELMRRNTDALRSLNESTNHYSRRLLLLTLVLLTVAFLQLVLTIFNLPVEFSSQVIVFIGVLLFFGWLFWDIRSELDSTD